MADIMRKTLLPVLLLLLPTTAFATKAQVINGVAVVRNIGPNRVAVLLDTNGDKSVDHGFLLSSDLPVSSTSARCPEASVEFTEGYVRVTYDKKVYDLHVAGYPEPPAIEQATTKFVGYALMHSSGTSGCNVENALTDAGTCFEYGKD